MISLTAKLSSNSIKDFIYLFIKSRILFYECRFYPKELRFCPKRSQKRLHTLSNQGKAHAACLSFFQFFISQYLPGTWPASSLVSKFRNTKY